MTPKQDTARARINGKHPYKSRPVGKSVEWLTPPWIIKSLGSFSLDPCCPENMPWTTAYRMLTSGGLEERWDGLRVWLNPPFGKETGKWLMKMATHGEGIALVFARTDTEMFFRWVWPWATGIMFLKGRPKFFTKDGKEAKGNSGGPICLIAYDARGKRENFKSLIRSGLNGKILPLYPCYEKLEEFK